MNDVYQDFLSHQGRNAEPAKARDEAKRMIQMLVENRKETLVKRRQEQVQQGLEIHATEEKRTTIKDLIRQSYYKPMP